MKKTFKKALSLVLAIVLMFGCAPLINLADFCLVASAANYTDGDFTFAINDDSSATITKYSGRAEIVEVPESVSDGQFEHTVVKIGAKAFADCQSSEVTFPENIYALCGAIFDGSSVTEVTIKGRITYSDVIDPFTYNGPFYGSKVTTVTMEQSNIPRCLFSGCSTLKTVNLPTEIKNANDKISDHAFNGCVSLESISIPNGIKVIESAAFHGCTFEEILLPNSIESIGSCAFSSCTKLQSVVFPESVYSLGGAIFDGSSVTEVTIKGRITYSDVIDPFTYNGPFYGSKVTTVTMEQSNIPRCLFSGCSTLKTVNLPTEIKNANDKISDHAFNGCINLESISIPEGIKAIASEAFFGCRNLKFIIIPSSVTIIGKQAFNSCNNLKYIHFNTTNCTYADLTDNLSTVICTSIVENPLGLTICDHNVNHDIPVIPPDEPVIPEEPEVVEKESSNGIKVKYDSTYFDNNDNIVLKAEEKDIENSNIAEYDEDGVLIKRYDIHLEDNNGNIVMSNESSTEYTVRIPVPTGYESYKQFLIRHWITLANGTKKGEVLNGKVENGYIVFKTTSFSDFDICNFGFEQKSMELIYTSTASLVATKDKDLTVTYTSSNPKVVTIDENGSITTHGRGNATITAMVETEKGETIKDTCEVTVKFTFWQWLIYIILFGFLWY